MSSTSTLPVMRPSAQVAAVGPPVQNWPNADAAVCQAAPFQAILPSEPRRSLSTTPHDPPSTISADASESECRMQEEEAAAAFRRGKQCLTEGQYGRAYQVFSSPPCEDYSPAQFIMSEMHLRGILGRRDIDRAIELLEMAVDRGHVYAKGRLAQIYLHGTHLPGARCLFCGLKHPRTFFRGVRLWLSALRDGLLCSKSDEPTDERFQI
jgi:TPR repeat protein